MRESLEAAGVTLEADPMTGPGASDAMAIDAAVERLLVAAGRDAAWPATPDLRASVLARIEAPERTGPRDPACSPGSTARRSAGRRMRALRPLAIAAILVILLAGLAAGLGFSLPGLDLGRTAADAGGDARARSTSAARSRSPTRSPSTGRASSCRRRCRRPTSA